MFFRDRLQSYVKFANPKVYLKNYLPEVKIKKRVFCKLTRSGDPTDVDRRFFVGTLID